jgi:hypothetical protein
MVQRHRVARDVAAGHAIGQEQFFLIDELREIDAIDLHSFVVMLHDERTRAAASNAPSTASKSR